MGAGRGLTGWMMRSRRFVVVIMLVAMMPLMFACYGNFPLTKAVYVINGNIANDLLEQIVFWVFVILPVYGTAMLADAVVLNLLEFWLGIEVELADASAVEMLESQDGERAVVTLPLENGEETRIQFVRESERRCEVRSMDGALLGVARRTEDGGVEFTDADGHVVRELTAAQVDRLYEPATPSTL